MVKYIQGTYCILLMKWVVGSYVVCIVVTTHARMRLDANYLNIILCTMTENGIVVDLESSTDYIYVL